MGGGSGREAFGEFDGPGVAAAAEAPADPAVDFLIARLKLLAAEPQAAQAALEHALAHGLPRERAVPYLAEIAFLQRNFGEAARLVRELGESRH